MTLDLNRLWELAALGLNEHQIADRMGVSRSTLYNHMKDDPEVKAARDGGLSEALEVAARGIQDLVRQGNLGAMLALLKYRGGWGREPPATAPATITVEFSPPAESVILPDAEEMFERHRLMIEGSCGRELE